MSIKKHIAIALSAIILLTGGAIASAQTVDTTSTASTTTGTTTQTPGTPNTGAGGDATANWLLLGATGVVALAGIAYLAGRPRPSSNQ